VTVRSLSNPLANSSSPPASFILKTRWPEALAAPCAGTPMTLIAARPVPHATPTKGVSEKKKLHTVEKVGRSFFLLPVSHSAPEMGNCGRSGVERIPSTPFGNRGRGDAPGAGPEGLPKQPLKIDHFSQNTYSVFLLE
jgi:hypothetical protein